MVQFPNGNFARPTPDTDHSQPYRANIIFQGKLIFAICLSTIDYHQFLVACQHLLLSRLGIMQEIKLWCLGTSANPSITTPYKISSHIEFRNTFGEARRSEGYVVRNFLITCEPAANPDPTPLHKRTLKQQTYKKHPTKGLKNISAGRAFRLLEIEASHSHSIQSQLRLLNRAFKEIMPPTSNNARAGKHLVLYERRRRQFVTMLMIMRNRPQRCSIWLNKMQRQHAGNVRMLQILSILHIFSKQFASDT